MTDEKFTFIEDVRDKKRTATGAHHKRTHCGKGGAVKFPSDFMTKKERDAMNGEVKSYKLNEPMTWSEFKAMPQDIQRMYIQALRDKYGVSDTKIFQMLGICQSAGQRHLTILGISGARRNRHTPWDKDGWYAWVGGVPKKEDVREETAEEVTEEVPHADLKFAEMKYDEPPKKIVPRCGTMCFDGNAREALAAIGLMLGDENVRLNVTWEVCNED